MGYKIVTYKNQKAVSVSEDFVFNGFKSDDNGLYFHNKESIPFNPTSVEGYSVAARIDNRVDGNVLIAYVTPEYYEGKNSTFTGAHITFG